MTTSCVVKFNKLLWKFLVLAKAKALMYQILVRSTLKHPNFLLLWNCSHRSVVAPSQQSGMKKQFSLKINSLHEYYTNLGSILIPFVWNQRIFWMLFEGQMDGTMQTHVSCRIPHCIDYKMLIGRAFVPSSMHIISYPSHLPRKV